MKKKLGKIILVSILIATLSMLDFIVLGQNIAIAMEEQRNISTNIKNVEFDSYLNNEEATISSERFLNLEINVKEKGILSEGKIKIENANFTLQKDKVQNTYIKNINLETNEIELNSIVYGNRVKLEIPIQFHKKENLEADYFQKETTISLEGKYKDETEQKVETKRNLKVNWTENTDIILNQEIKKYRVIPEIGVLLQQEITTEVVNNALPRENETLLIQVPILEQQPKEIYVIENGIRLAEEQVEYISDANVVQIRSTNNLIWGKAKNNYQVIYLYDQETEANNRTIEINATSCTKLFTKEETKKTETKSVEISPMGNIVSLQKDTTNELYKGYLYAKAQQDTTYTENNTIQISNQETTESIELTKENEEFSDDTNVHSIKDQTIYKSTKVKKEEFDRILGEDGQITISNEEGNVIAQMTKETQTDESGNIIINYETEINDPKITISKPVTEGEITISHTKAIKAEQGYSKEQLKKFTKLITKTKANEEIAQAQITLKDTKTEAKLEINNTNLSTLQTNENVHFLITLKSDSIEYDLYKNPTVKIVLPAELMVQVKNITQLNAQDEIKIVDSILYEGENKQKIIQMQLQGEQTHFENAVNEGIQISITADISMEKTVPTKDTQITMLYTNENRPGEEFSKVVPIKLNSKYGVLMVNTIANYNNEGDKIENIDDKVKEAKLDIGEEAKTATQDVTIINNYENEITDVAILGKIPTIGTEEINGEELRATFEMELTEGVKTAEKAQIYYSENPNEERNSKNWTQTPEDFTKVKSFKLTLQDNTLQPSEGLKLSYPLAIAENLGESQASYTNLTLSYNYLGDNVDSNSTFSLKTEETQMEEKEAILEKTNRISIQIQGRTGGKVLTEGQEVYEGQGIKYIARITNTSEEEIKNLKLVATQENAIFYDKKVYQDGWDSISGNEEVEYTRIEENPELTKKEIQVETIKPGETIEIPYQFSVKQIQSNKQASTYGKIVITADNIEEKEIKTLENPILTGKIKLQMNCKLEEEYDVTTNRELPILLNISNISNITQKDITLSVPVPEQFDFSTDSLFEAEDYEFIEYKNREVTLKIPTLEENQTITIRLGFQIKSMNQEIDSQSYSFTYQGTLGDQVYVSNEMDRKIYNIEADIEAKQYGSIQGEWVEKGDTLTYTCEIENKGNKSEDLDITDYVPTGANIQKARIQKYNMEEGPKLVEEKEIEFLETLVIYHHELQAKEKIVLIIDTVINTDQIFTKEITNDIFIYGMTQEILCNSTTYKVKGKENLEDPEATYAIRGIAWVDENKNGLREATEKRLPEINVFLMNEETGEYEIESQTNEEGRYEFVNLKPGKYFVIFQYEANQYRVTEYQKAGISNENNSDVISKTISLQEKEQPIAMTGTLELINQDLNYIDAGFIPGEKFDFKLDKYISKIILQNRKETKVQQYNQAQLAKIELDSKQINSTSLVIEYKIQITNEGEIPGYANEIIDYKPVDLSFSSEMNKNWYQTTNGELCSQELSNQQIQPGETKTVTLTLTKNMNENNAGTIINTAEIKKASNDYLIQDIDSIENNKISGEDDISTAEVIISLRTGGVMIAVSFISIIIMIIGIGIYFIKKKII